MFRLCGIRGRVRCLRGLSESGLISGKNGLTIKRKNAKLAASNEMYARRAFIVMDNFGTPGRLVSISKSADLGATRTWFSDGTMRGLRRLLGMESEQGQVKGEISYDRRSVRIQIDLGNDHGVALGQQAATTMVQVDNRGRGHVMQTRRPVQIIEAN